MEVVLEIMRMVLEYLGWDRDEIEELFNSQRRSRGYRRSIVRRIGRELPQYRLNLFTKRSIIRKIGSRLPLKPCRRPYFAIDANRNGLETDFKELEGKPLSQMLMASLADVGWITGNEDIILSPEQSPIKTELQEITAKEKESSLADEGEAKKDNLTNNSEAMLKISALEDELQKLRAQIAMMLVSSPQNPEQHMNLTPTTPMGAPVPPPPPLPPPPPPTPHSTPVKPISQIIRENRAKRLSLAPGMLTDHSASCSNSLPNMTEVLKGLGKVKLRSIERSPGGTPLRKPPLQEEGTDPASIIAQALKKKFAHRRLQEANSPNANKENNSPGSPFGTPPSSPIKSVAFGPHLLKPATNRRRSSTGLKRRSSASPLVQVC